ncbi:ATP-binding cassette domain-containing protein, partial [Virgibacillus halodenitrificans]|nr:ATP-binding cassette domain-containing protein [Virgibacillus halodenitrificans]
MVLKLNKVTKRFGTHTAVDQLSLEIPEKEMFGFLGGNGAGKTTTFRMILGLLDATEGEISWNGETINYNKSHLIGYLPEERGLYPKLTVKEQLIYLGKLRGMHKNDVLTGLKGWLDRFQVPEYLNKKVEELSKGNQQKIQFISAVLHEPKLLILDEPFSGLDPINVEMLKEAVVD